MPDAKGVPGPVVWASGSNGMILKSVDEGKTWKRLPVNGGDALDFRGIVAFSEKVAYLMSSGEGEKSRIYKTTDGGETWKLQYTDKRKEFFLDAIACLSETHCFALGDPIDGKFLLLNTTDGEHWNPLPRENCAAALPCEGAFAASNPCLAISGEEIFFGTGGPAARVFPSLDSGRTWTAAETPIASGKASAGIFSLTIGDDNRVMAVGGDYRNPAARTAWPPIPLMEANPGNSLRNSPAATAPLWLISMMGGGWPSDPAAKTSPMTPALTGSIPIR